MHSMSVPALLRGLSGLLAWLDKAQAHAEARKFEPNQFLNCKLAPDMLPLSRQIQIASDTAKGCVARLSGAENPKWEDSETTLDELRERIRRTQAFVAGFAEEHFAGSEAREVAIPIRGGEVLKFTGEAYLREWALPNFYFHCTAAYLLLRHGGVELGKADFLGRR